MKNTTGIAAVLLCMIAVTGCGDSGGPLETDSKLRIEAGPQFYSFPTSIDTVVFETSPVHIADRDGIPNGSFDYMSMDFMVFPGGCAASYDDAVARDFVIRPGDFFRVEIPNCRTALPWFTKLDADRLILVGRDSTAVSSELYNMRYTFRAVAPGKGYAGFVETDTSFGGCTGGCYSSNSKSLIVGYTAGVVEDLFVDLDKITWEYDFVPCKCGPGEHSTVAVLLSGSTNAYRLKVETYGDGVTSCCEMDIGDDSRFNRKIGIAFRFGYGEYLKIGTRLVVFGTVGPPKVILLENPLDD